MIKFSGFCSPDISRLGQRSQGTQGVEISHLIIVGAMDKLQELDGELDITKSPWPQLDLIIHFLSRNMGADALAHPLHLFHKSGPGGGSPNQWFQSFAVAAS